MKTITLFAMLSVAFSIETNAQSGMNVPGGMNAQANALKSQATTGMGGMIAKFTDKISPSALTPEFLKGKSGFVDKANGTTDAKGSSTLLKTLEAGIKSSAFQSAWAAEKPKWEAKVSAIKSPKDVEEALKSLGSNLKPEMLKNDVMKKL